MLVLGELREVHYDTDGAGDYSEWRFRPESVWSGSANWTEAARSHLEIGFWSDDRTLAEEATSFVADVIAFSEPVGSTCALGPKRRARARYRWRTRIRRRLPWFLLNRGVAAKGQRDCGDHEWHKATEDEDRCYHCEVGVRRPSGFPPSP